MATLRDGNHIGMTRLQQVKLLFLVLILLVTLFQWSLIFRLNLQEAKQGGGHLLASTTFLLQESLRAKSESATETNTVNLKGAVGTTSASHTAHTVGGVDGNPRKENSIKKSHADSNHTSRATITQLHSTQKTITVAYAISVTACPVNQSHIVLDGAAVLGHSIHLHSVRSSNNTSRYDYALFAFVHADAQACTAPLQQLGYQVQLKTELPFNVSQASPSLLEEIEKQGCCGSKEFLKLYVYSLTDYPLALHLDTDTLVVQPMDELFDSLLKAGDEDRSLPQDHVAFIQHHLPKSSSNSSLLLPSTSTNFLFTRDYHQQSKASKNPKHYGVQGLARPSQPNILR
jgi:alpha-N-acetylglucosamine transferase